MSKKKKNKKFLKNLEKTAEYNNFANHVIQAEKKEIKRFNEFLGMEFDMDNDSFLASFFKSLKFPKDLDISAPTNFIKKYFEKFDRIEIHSLTYREDNNVCVVMNGYDSDAVYGPRAVITLCINAKKRMIYIRIDEFCSYRTLIKWEIN